MRLRIVIGEPDFDAYEAMRERLADAGHEVSWAKNGSDAVRLAREYKADLLFVDAQAPEVPGAKACRQAKADRPGIRTVLLAVGAKSPAGEGDVDAVLEKPVEPRQLDRLMRDLLVGRPGLRPKPRSPATTTPERDSASASGTPASGTTVAAKPAADGAAPVDARLKPIDRVVAPPVPPEGSLTQVSVPRLLHVLAREGRSGCLTVSREKTTKRVFLRGGVPVYVVSNVAAESLGRHLLAASRITLTQYNALITAMLEGGRPQPLLLLETGILSPHELVPALEGLAREKLIALFAWEAGSYAFQRGEFQIGQENLTPIAVPPLLIDGIRRHYDLTRLVHFFSEIKRAVPALAPTREAAEATAALRPADHPLVALIDGTRTLGKIVGGSPLSLTETFQVLYYLIQVEAVRLVAVREPAKARRTRADAAARPPARAEFEALVERTYAALPGLDHYQVLGLDPAAPAERVRAAYLALTRQFRPYDLHAAASPVVREKADAIFRRLTLASEVLLDAGRRARYAREQGAPGEIERIEREALHRSRRPRTETVADRPADRPAALPPERPAEPPAEIDLPAPAAKPVARPPAPPTPPTPSAPPEAVKTPIERPAERPAERPTERPTERAFERPPLPRPPVPKTVPRAIADADLEFDVFEIGVGEALDIEDETEEIAASGGERGPAEWVAVDPGADLSALIEEGMHVTSEVANRLKGELRYQEGERLLETGDYGGAAARFEEALSANPEEAEYHAFLGWSLFNLNPLDAPTVARARALIEQAVRLNPTLDEAHFFLGKIALQDKAVQKAKDHFLRAVQCNPLHERAAEMLRRV